MTMKKVFAFLLALLMIISFASCNQTEEPEVTTSAPIAETTAPTETESVTEAPTDCAHSYTETVIENLSLVTLLILSPNVSITYPI